MPSEEDRRTPSPEVERLRAFERGWNEIEAALGRSETERAAVDLTHYVPELAREVKRMRNDGKRLRMQHTSYRDLSKQADARIRQLEALVQHYEEAVTLPGNPLALQSGATAQSIEPVKIGALVAERDGLREFAEQVVEATCWGRYVDDLDGGDCQEWAERLGIIREIPGGFDPEKHDDDSGACEPGDKFYQFTSALAKHEEGSDAE